MEITMKKNLIPKLAAAVTMTSAIATANTNKRNVNLVEFVEAVDIVQCQTEVIKEEETLLKFEVNHLVPRIAFEHSPIAVLAEIFNPGREFPEWLENSSVGVVEFNPQFGQSNGDSDKFTLQYFLTEYNGKAYQNSCINFGDYESEEQCESIIAEIAPGEPGSLWVETTFDDAGLLEYRAELGPFGASIWKNDITLKVECFDEENNLSVRVDDEDNTNEEEDGSEQEGDNDTEEKQV